MDFLHFSARPPSFRPNPSLRFVCLLVKPIICRGSNFLPNQDPPGAACVGGGRGRGSLIKESQKFRERHSRTKALSSGSAARRVQGATQGGKDHPIQGAAVARRTECLTSGGSIFLCSCCMLLVTQAVAGSAGMGKGLRDGYKKCRRPCPARLARPLPPQLTRVALH